MPEIHIAHDAAFDIAIGRTRRELSWKNEQWLWSKFVNRVATTHRTHESYQEYCAAKVVRQGELKDHGGFVGGYLTGGKRNRRSVLSRQLITLDIDHSKPGAWDDFTMLYENAAVCYSTHKHCPEKPRLRLILPLDREVGPDEYQAIARRFAGNLGIDIFDRTTFEPSRLMYWPSTSKNGVYEFNLQDGPFLCADKILATYKDWRDMSAWPMSEDAKSHIHGDMDKQGDPLEKPGVIGAFCRTFTMTEAIETFLEDVYSACDVEDRYTYKDGSTSGGLVVYDDKYTYSHHGTDPTSMKLCNAFDLVRIHKFGLKDEDARDGTPGNKLPSYAAMVEFATKDTRVRKLLGEERFAQANADFDDSFADDVDEFEPELPLDMDWITKLDVDKKGTYYSSLDNIAIILENDPRLKGRIFLDQFEQREGVKGNLPWRKVTKESAYLTDRDIANLRHYLEKTYGISSAPKIEDGLKVILEKNQIHPIKDYLNGLVWDGKERICNLLTDYLGVLPSDYSRAVMRKTLAAAVTRIYRPGCKFDYVLTFVGAQGLKKSMLVDKLGGAWFSDSFTTIQGKEAYEQLQGAWLIEMAELSGLKKADVETIKHFVTKRSDQYRVAYGRRVDKFPRQCIFFATTNVIAFLKDTTGSRRWWPVLVHAQKPIKDIDKLLQPEIDQIWAEAVTLYKAGELLYLTPELEAVATAMQEEHTEADERTGTVQKYLETLLPDDWEQKGIYERRAWLAGDELQPLGLIQRDRVCAVEIFCEALGGKIESLTKYNTKDIHDMMRTIPDWELSKKKMRFGVYGVLKGYVYTGNGKSRIVVSSTGMDFNDEEEF